MNCTIHRIQFNVNGIYSNLVDDSGNLLSVTLEHAFPNSLGGYDPIIQPGIYTCTRRHSPRFGFDVFQVMNVPGHTFVEMHIGNRNSDSDGCVLLGECGIGDGNGFNMVTNSRETFDKFMELQSGVESFTLTVLA